MGIQQLPRHKPASLLTSRAHRYEYELPQTEPLGAKSLLLLRPQLWHQRVVYADALHNVLLIWISLVGSTGCNGHVFSPFCQSSTGLPDVSCPT